MPILKASELAPDSEETRQATLAEGILAPPHSVPGFVCVRRITPLVMAALQRANNPYITARKGFEAMGVEFDEEGNQLTDAASFGVAMLPKTAEVLLLMSCTREQLKRYAVSPQALESDALDIVEDSTLETLAQATAFITSELQLMAKTQVIPAPEDEKPSAEALKGGAEGSKKPARTG
jgi:hypothetical protein